METSDGKLQAIEDLPIAIPANMAEYIRTYHGANLSINFNHVDALNGYGGVLYCTVELSCITRTCRRCGYDLLWKPDDIDSKCLRHAYGSWRYDTVFAYSPVDNELSLEDAFAIWLKAQPASAFQPRKQMMFGKVGR